VSCAVHRNVAVAFCLALSRLVAAQPTPIKLETGEAPPVPAPTWIEGALSWSPWVGAFLGLALIGAWAVRRGAARRNSQSPEERALHELARVIGFSAREVRAIVAMAGSPAGAMAAMVSRESFRRIGEKSLATLEGASREGARDAAARLGCPEVFDDSEDAKSKLTPTSKRMLEIIRGKFLAHLNKPRRKARAGKR
jgi:hypothetical protein